MHQLGVHFDAQRTIQTMKCAHNVRLAMPLKARYADDFALANVQINVRSVACNGQIAHANENLALHLHVDSLRSCGGRCLLPFANHQREQIVIVYVCHIAGLNYFAVSHYGNAVTDVVQFLHSMGNEENDLTLRLVLIYDVLYGLHILCVQRRGDLVDHQNIEILKQRLSEFYQILFV